MSNEMTYANLGDLRQAKILAQEVLMLLKDKTSIRNHPSLVYAGDAVGTGTATISVPALGWGGYDEFSAVAEGAAVGTTALTDDSFDVSVGRQAKQYKATDLARITDGMGFLNNPSNFALDAVRTADKKLLTLVAALASGFSQQVGSSGADLTIAVVFGAMTLLEANDAEGPFLALWHSQQFGDFRYALSQESGALQFNEATQEQMRLRGNGYKGDWLGMDIFTSTKVETANAGADRLGSIMARGSVIYADATIPPDPMARDQIFAGKVMVEFARDADRGIKSVTSNYYLGVAEAIDLAAVGILSDA